MPDCALFLFQTNKDLLYPCKMNVFGGILESPCLSVHVSMCPSLCLLSVYKILVSVKVLGGRGGITTQYCILTL